MLSACRIFLFLCCSVFFVGCKGTENAGDGTNNPNGNSADLGGLPDDDLCKTNPSACKKPCTRNEDCTVSPLVRCDLSTKLCVGCLTNDDCKPYPGVPFCNGGRCVECTNNDSSQCSLQKNPFSEGPTCASNSNCRCGNDSQCTGNPNGKQCEQFTCSCLAQADCTGNSVCDGWVRFSGTTVQTNPRKCQSRCRDNADCSSRTNGLATNCDGTSGRCFKCKVGQPPGTAPCPAARKHCLYIEDSAEGGSCYECKNASATATTKDSDCDALTLGKKPYCSKGKCVACAVASGTQTTQCSAADTNKPYCLSNVCVACGSDSQCSSSTGGTKPRCTTDGCAECSQNSDCNGKESGKVCFTDIDPDNATFGSYRYKCGCHSPADCTSAKPSCIPGSSGPFAFCSK